MLLSLLTAGKNALRTSQKNLHWIVPVCGVCCVFLYLVSASITWGLPFQPDMDELYWIPNAVRMSSKGTLNPGWFGHPGSTVLYPLGLLYHLYSIGIGGGVFEANPSLWTTFEQTPSDFFILGRYVSLFYGTLCIPLLFLLGTAVRSKVVGLIAIVLYLSYPMPITHSTIVRSDMAATFFVLLSLFLMNRVLEKRTTRNLVCAGIAIGLAVATRFFSVALMIPLLYVCWKTRKEEHTSLERNLLIGIAVSAIAFLVTTPYILLDLQTAITDLLHEARDIRVVRIQEGPILKFLYYLLIAIPLNSTWPQLLCGIGGMVSLFKQKKAATVLLLLFLISHIVIICIPALFWPRWIIQILPIIALFAAIGIEKLVQILSKYIRIRPAVLLFICTGVFLCMNIAGVTHVIMRRAYPTTELVAREWMIEHLPAGSHIGVEWLAVQLVQTPFFLESQSPLPEGGSLNEWRAKGVTHLVVNRSVSQDYIEDTSNEFAGFRSFYAELEKEGVLIKEIQPHIQQYGSHIQIYKIQ